MRSSSVTRRLVAYAPLAAVLVVLLPTLSAAQELVKSFDQLNTRLKVGDTVWVTDAQGREVKGKITDLRDASITLNSDGQTTRQAESVRLVQQKRRGISMLLGCLIGFGAGVAGGFAFSAAAETGDEATGGYLFPPIGAGVGTLIGAFMPRTRNLYRAPGASGSARLSLAPVIMPRTKAAAVSYSF
jgi:hypothetical protein